MRGIKEKLTTNILHVQHEQVLAVAKNTSIQAVNGIEKRFLGSVFPRVAECSNRKLH
jgi:hypothetical protein